MHQIGTLTLKNPLILGPMAGVTDHPFRLLCHEMGAALVSMEMVSANAVRYGNKKTFELIDIGEDEHPVSMQLFGPDPKTFAIAIDALRSWPYDILDINMGCPMPKIVKNGEGSALMLNPPLAEDIIRECVRLSDRPVTVKLRAGFHEGERTAVELAKRAEQAGAAAVAIHGRTREQYYTGRADWSIIREVKEAVSIPVIGNGDVTDKASAAAMLRETGCDFVMIGRASRGNPWIFREAAAGLEARGLSAAAEKIVTNDSSDIKNAAATDAAVTAGRPTLREICDMILRHTRMQLEEKGAYLGICQMRKHISWYTTGLPDSAALRSAVNQAKDFDEIKALLDAWLARVS